MSLKNINDALKAANQAKKLTQPKKKKTTAKKTTTTKTVIIKEAAPAKAPVSNVNIVENLRFIEAAAESKGDKKLQGMTKDFASLTMKNKPNRKEGEKLMDMFGPTSEASVKIREILI